MDTCAYALVTPPESDMCIGDSTRRKASAWNPQEGDACAVVIPPDGGICKCFGASTRGVDWMVTPQTRLQAGSLQTFNAGVPPRKGGDKGSPINKKCTPQFVTWGGLLKIRGATKMACHPLFWTPKKAHPLKIGVRGHPLKIGGLGLQG